MMLGLAWAGKWDQTPADVVVTREVPHSQEAVYERLTDLQAWPQIFPASCLDEWALGTPTSGAGANTMLTYRMSGMKRRLLGTITKAEPAYLVELDHAGKKGFTTQIVLETTESGGTRVQLGTYLVAPPWPLRGYYFNKVQPAWKACYSQALETLAGS